MLEQTTAQTVKAAQAASAKAARERLWAGKEYREADVAPLKQANARLRAENEMLRRRINRLEKTMTALALSGYEKTYSAVDIISAVTKISGIARADRQSNARVRDIAKWKHIERYLLRRHAKLDDKQIGSMVGGFDRTTVIHSLYKITNNFDLFASDIIDVETELAKASGIIEEGG